VKQSSPIYKRDSAGKLRIWFYEVDGDKYRTTAGLEGGSLVTSEWTLCKPKSKATGAEQAAFEAQAEENKKLDREYRRSPTELDQVPTAPMLAQDFVKQKSVGFPVWSQPKLDGIRAKINRHGAFSREYQRHLNVDHILEALAPLFATMPNLELDGELYNHDLKDDFNKITSIVRKQSPTDEQRAEARNLIQYHVYDIPSLGHFPFGYRWGQLSCLMNDAPDINGIIVPVPTRLADDKERLDELYGEYLAVGYEGQMVRLDAPYEFDKRSKHLLKRKEFITAEFPLLRVEEGQGNWAGYAKRIVFKLPDGRECGAGMRGTQDFAKDLLKKASYWDHRAKVTVRHFAPTPDGMPRFPVAIDFHPTGRVD
jgi:DNA ligase-1